jgi:hypothetical protein
VSATEIIGLGMMAYGAWGLYMSIYRTEEYRKMREDNWNRGKAVCGGLFRAGMFCARNYRRWK